MEIKQTKLTYLGLPRSVYIIVIARVVNAMGNFVFPFMTLFLSSKAGMGEQEIGFFLLIGSSIQVPGFILGGRLADNMGRKKIMILFMGLAAICYLPCSYLFHIQVGLQYLPWIFILSAFFNSIAGPASGAMMNDLTIPDNRQAALSLLYMGMNVGTAIGSVFAGFLFNHYMEFLFLGDAVTTLLSILLLFLFIKDTKPTREEMKTIESDRKDEKEEKGGLISALLKRPLLLMFIIFDSIYSFIYAQCYFSLPLQTKAIFGEILGARFYGTFNMINCFEVIFLTTVITLITKRLKAIYNVSIAGLFFAVGFGMLFFARSIGLFVVSTIIWTIGEIINATNVGVYLANHTPISHRGRFNSIINIISGTGGAISPYIIGGMIAAKGVTNIWPYIFFLSIAASFFMLLLGVMESRKKC